jgi:hypothetical protein
MLLIAENPALDHDELCKLALDLRKAIAMKILENRVVSGQSRSLPQF